MAIKGGGGARLTELMAELEPETEAAAMLLLTRAGEGLATARKLLTDKDAIVRKAAVEAVFALDKSDGYDQVIKTLKSSNNRDVLWGCENALLSKRDDAAHVKRTIDTLVPRSSRVPSASRPRRSLRERA